MGAAPDFRRGAARRVQIYALIVHLVHAVQAASHEHPIQLPTIRVGTNSWISPAGRKCVPNAEHSRIHHFRTHVTYTRGTFFAGY